jgi:hypothetical protein
MPISFLFWLLMILWLIFGLGGVWYDGPYRRHMLAGGNLLIFILLFLLGWSVFGFIVK